jgi:FKBP-type peptidyl-prolyl cis-trans isomerase 2
LIRVVITAISKTHITLDANPPLAGRDLTFTIEVVECTSP